MKANGVLILILGILSWTGLSIVTAIPAWILGNQSLKAIDQGLADPSERGMVEVGRWLGIANVILSLLGALIAIVMIVVLMGGLGYMYQQAGKHG